MLFKSLAKQGSRKIMTSGVVGRAAMGKLAPRLKKSYSGGFMSSSARMMKDREKLKKY